MMRRRSLLTRAWHATIVLCGGLPKNRKRRHVSWLAWLARAAITMIVIVALSIEVV